MINTVALMGNLTRDSEIRYTSGGTAAVKFSLAVNRRKKVGDQWQDEAMFFDCDMMGKAAEGVQKYLMKGKKVAIQGELRQDRWEQDGQKRSKVYIFVSSLQLAGERSENSSNSQPHQAQSQSSQQGFEDDIPF